MKILGVTIPFTGEKALSPVSSNSGGWYRILESFAGAWQTNVEVNFDSVLSYHADFACRTLIASDISKLRVKLVQKDADGIWNEVTNPAYSPVLRKPNKYQNRIQFFETWMLSKLQRGNTYVLKQRDRRGVVTSLYVLDPQLVKVLVADNGDVYYELNADNLSNVEERIVVPAAEIIHDRFNCFFHPLVGISPIFAGGLAATQGLSIQNDSTKFFQNGAQPGGILTAPAAISDDTARRLKEYWETEFSGNKTGKLAIVGDGMKYEAMRSKAVDSQLIEQLKWSAEIVCGVYHVPTFMVGVGQEPSYNNVQNLTIRYYSQCLQILIEQLEACLDEGLGMDGITIGVEFDRDGLLQMDAMTQMDVLEKSKGKMTVNEQRGRLNLSPVEGGDTVYLQEQDHSLQWLSRRDAMPIEQPAAAPEPEAGPEEPANDNSEEAREMRSLRRRSLLAGSVGLKSVPIHTQGDHA